MEFIDFRLKNFKGISEEITIDIANQNNNLFCLLGNNEAGKTTILKGIELIGNLCKNGFDSLQNGKLNEKISEIRPKSPFFTGDILLSTTISFTEDDLNNIFNQNSTDNTNIQAYKDKISTHNRNILVKFIYSFQKNTLSSKKQEISVGGENILDDQIKTKIFTYIQETCCEIIFYSDFEFQAPAYIRFLSKIKSQPQPDQQPNQLINDKDLTSDNNTSWQDVFGDLLLAVENDEKSNNTTQESNINKDNAFQEYVVDYNPQDSNDDTASQRITAMNSKINEVVTKNWEDTQTKQDIKFDRFVIKAKEPQDANFNDYTLSIEDNKSTFALHERSKGCQWFFSFKIRTDIRINRNSKRGFLFLLDEPASNLHIHPQEKILKSLSELAEKPNIKIIYSTHSPFLVNVDGKENIFIITNNRVELSKDSNIKIAKINEFDIKNGEENIMPCIYSAIASDVKESGIKEENGKKIFSLTTFKDVIMNIGDVAELTQNAAFKVTHLLKFLGILQ